MGCWAHARRKFEKALDYDRKRAGYVMEQIQKLYAIEREARQLGLDPEGRKQLRLDKALPVINQLGQQLAEMYQDVLPRSPLGNALGRKNYLFTGSHSGAQRAAMFYSFFGTCSHNGVNSLTFFILSFLFAILIIFVTRN